MKKRTSAMKFCTRTLAERVSAVLLAGRCRSVPSVGAKTILADWLRLAARALAACAVAVTCPVAVPTRFGVNVTVGVGVAGSVGVGEGVAVKVAVAVGVGVRVNVGAEVDVGAKVAVNVRVGVAVGAAVGGTGVDVRVGLGVFVAVGATVLVAVGGACVVSTSAMASVLVGATVGGVVGEFVGAVVLVAVMGSFVAVRVDVGVGVSVGGGRLAAALSVFTISDRVAWAEGPGSSAIWVFFREVAVCSSDETPEGRPSRISSSATNSTAPPPAARTNGLWSADRAGRSAGGM